MNSKLAIHIAAELLAEGKVVAIPTETVYGLAANALDEKAVKQIFEIKQRPAYNPLIVHLKSLTDLDRVASSVPPKALQLAEHFWPGPLTLVLPKQAGIPDVVTAAKPTVAVRVPAHPVARKLLEAVDFPLAAPSANPFGYISPTTAAHVQKQLGTKIPFVLDGGKCTKGIESTIIGFANGEPILYRVGAIPVATIEKLIGPIGRKTGAASNPEAPGMLSKHYSPRTTFQVSETIEADLEKYAHQAVGFMLFSNIKSPLSKRVIRLTASENMEEAAQNLYAAMHELDEAGLRLIVAEKFPETGIGISLNDRLYRAQQQQ